MSSDCEALTAPMEWLAPEQEPISWHEDEDAEAIRIMADINECAAELEEELGSVTRVELCISTEATLVERFREQAEKWARETAHLSSPTQMMAHPSYQAILGMASEDKRKIISLMILDLKQNRNEWFWALSYLTQDNPIKHSDAGKMDKMISAWVNWGLERNLI